MSSQSSHSSASADGRGGDRPPMPPGLTRRCPGETLDGLPLEIFRSRYPASVMALAVELHHRCRRGDSCRWESPVTLGRALGFKITVRKDGRELCRTVELALGVLRRDGWIHTVAQRFGGRSDAVDVHWLLWLIGAPTTAREADAPRPSPRPQRAHSPRPGAKICATVAQILAPATPPGASSCAVLAQKFAPASSLEACSNSEGREFNVNVARAGGTEIPTTALPTAPPPTDDQVANELARLRKTSPTQQALAKHRLWTWGRLPAEHAEWRPPVDEPVPEPPPRPPAYPPVPKTVPERLGMVGPWMTDADVDALADAWSVDFRDGKSFHDYRAIIRRAIRGEIPASRLRYAHESIMPSVRNGTARAPGGLLHSLIDGGGKKPAAGCSRQTVPGGRPQTVQT
jgi:hypothetical protein